MCRILELIIRNFKQSIQQPEEDEYNRESLIEAIESDEKVSFEKEAGESEAFYRPTESTANGT